MAIPFYEDEKIAAAAANLEPSPGEGDQVDGPAYAQQADYDEVDYEQPQPEAAAAATSDSTAKAPTTEEQLLAWKLLALTMCKVLKQFYMKQQPTNKKDTKLTATVQLQPQAQ
ncbi:uncharacterized protein LOC108599227 [Drosophila busckii]|uniref:uncharacterized protein LOC108599227 n=1 Tax=Drosophila busckii TaxID=30019 RepID=UPI00143300DB|nr:uncharacterized protein LOC108599227 [Drosophila busckii]